MSTAHPAAGRFLSRDTVSAVPGGDATGFNRYLNGNASPLNFFDPDGRWSLRGAWNKAVGFVKEVSGYNDLKGCVGGSLSSCAWFAAGFTPVGKIGKFFELGRGSKAARVGTGSKARPPRNSSRVVRQLDRAACADGRGTPGRRRRRGTHR